MDDVDKMIDRLLAGEETESEIGRVRAYRRCVRHAESELATEHVCNVFLLRAAERLGQTPMAIPVVHNIVPLPDDARLCLYYHEDEGPTLVGNPSGLRYLSDLIGELSESPLPGENVILDEGYAPWVGDSEGLTLYCENEEWFDAAEEGTEDELADAYSAEIEGRIVSDEQIAAVQLVGPVPVSLALTPQKLYRVESIGPLSADKSVRRKPYHADLARVRELELIDDDNEPLRFAVDLDDPDLCFYYPWHLEQFGLSGG